MLHFMAQAHSPRKGAAFTIVLQSRQLWHANCASMRHSVCHVHCLA